MEQWSKTPKYILRQKCLEYVIRDWEPASFIEFGAGIGGLTTTLIKKGFYGKCYDISEINREILKRNLEKYINSVEIIYDTSQLNPFEFDYIFSFEVLEHIEDDITTLKQWSLYLKPRGKILLSIPAHMRKFDQDDFYVGHIRRYEKIEIIHKLYEAGFRNIRVLNYGFPLGNMTRQFNKIIYNNKCSIHTKYNNNINSLDNSMKSGRERPRVTMFFSFLFSELFLYPFILLQRVFFNRDLGDGYIVYAEKCDKFSQKNT